MNNHQRKIFKIKLNYFYSHNIFLVENFVKFHFHGCSENLRLEKYLISKKVDKYVFKARLEIRVVCKVFLSFEYIFLSLFKKNQMIIYILQILNT